MDVHPVQLAARPKRSRPTVSKPPKQRQRRPPSAEEEVRVASAPPVPPVTPASRAVADTEEQTESSSKFPWGPHSPVRSNEPAVSLVVFARNSKNPSVTSEKVSARVQGRQPGLTWRGPKGLRNHVKNAKKLEELRLRRAVIQRPPVAPPPAFARDQHMMQHICRVDPTAHCDVLHALPRQCAATFSTTYGLLGQLQWTAVPNRSCRRTSPRTVTPNFVTRGAQMSIRERAEGGRLGLRAACGRDGQTRQRKKKTENVRDIVFAPPGRSPERGRQLGWRTDIYRAGEDPPLRSDSPVSELWYTGRALPSFEDQRVHAHQMPYSPRDVGASSPSSSLAASLELPPIRSLKPSSATCQASVIKSSPASVSTSLHRSVRSIPGIPRQTSHIISTDESVPIAWEEELIGTKAGEQRESSVEVSPIMLGDDNEVEERDMREETVQAEEEEKEEGERQEDDKDENDTDEDDGDHGGWPGDDHWRGPGRSGGGNGGCGGRSRGNGRSSGGPRTFQGVRRGPGSAGSQVESTEGSRRMSREGDRQQHVGQGHRELRPSQATPPELPVEVPTFSPLATDLEHYFESVHPPLAMLSLPKMDLASEGYSLLLPSSPEIPHLNVATSTPSPSPLPVHVNDDTLSAMNRSLPVPGSRLLSPQGLYQLDHSALEGQTPSQAHAVQVPFINAEASLLPHHTSHRDQSTMSHLARLPSLAVPQTQLHQPKQYIFQEPLPQHPQVSVSPVTPLVAMERDQHRRRIIPHPIIENPVKSPSSHSKREQHIDQAPSTIQDGSALQLPPFDLDEWSSFPFEQADVSHPSFLNGGQLPRSPSFDLLQEDLCQRQKVLPRHSEGSHVESREPNWRPHQHKKDTKQSEVLYGTIPSPHFLPPHST